MATRWLKLISFLSVTTAALKLVLASDKTLIWSDEFSEPQIDPDKWSFALGTGNNGWGNGELEYYTNRTENVFIENGHLVIQALKEEYEQSNYTSGRIYSKNKADFLYGRMEIRAKLPKGKGLWPAIWLLPTNYVHGPGIASGEIDIMELLGHQPNKVHCTVHFGKTWTDRGHKQGTFSLPSGTFADDFHIFSLDWTQDDLQFWVDTTLVMNFNRQDVPPKYVYPYDDYFYFLLNVAVGGDWPQNPDSSTHFPQRMEVDYVRVYNFTQ